MKTAGKSGTVFHQADVLYALEWAAVAPGVVRWRVLLDSEHETQLVSIIPPGAEQPGFAISRSGDQVLLTAHAMAESGQRERYFASLRQAVLAICPLDDERAIAVNEAMEILYPRSPDRT